MKEDKYFTHLSESCHLPDDANTIKADIEKTGVWVANEEWRISTETEFRISIIEKYQTKWFKVEVKCDHEFMCHCPTLERAMQMAKVYQSIIVNMFHDLGWPSWASFDKATP